MLMLLKKGLLRKRGQRTDTVTPDQAVKFGLVPGPSLVQQIRAQKEAERAAEAAQRPPAKARLHERRKRM